MYQSVQSLVPGGWTSVYGTDKSARLLGQYNGSCGWVLVGQVNSFWYDEGNLLYVKAKWSTNDIYEPRSALSALGSMSSKCFLLNPCVLGHIVARLYV